MFEALKRPDNDQSSYGHGRCYSTSIRKQQEVVDYNFERDNCVLEGDVNKCGNNSGDEENKKIKDGWESRFEK